MKEARGWAIANPIIHKFASSKGGKRKVPKGTAKLSPERRKEIASMGGKAKYANRSKELQSDIQNHSSGSIDEDSDSRANAQSEEQ